MYINKYAFGLVFLLFPILGYSTIINVPADHPTIQEAIDAAGDGDTVLLADGTYSGEGNYNLHWDATSKHLLIMSENGPDNCIIDCQSMGRGFYLGFGQTNEDVITGLTITNGRTRTNYPYVTGGGAIFIKSSSPQIINCHLLHNVAGDTIASTAYSYYSDGGAIDCVEESAPIIKGNIIRNNYANHTGGAIHYDNASSGVLENNIIDNNKNNGCYGGGGIALIRHSHPLIINNLIINNSSQYYSVGGFGGGIITMNANPTIINNTIANNTTMNGSLPGEGGGIRIRGMPFPIIINCILSNNIAKNSLENLDFQYSADLNISYSIIEGGIHNINAPENSTNINASPQFVDPENNNYQLRTTSPCVNKGDPDTTGLHLPHYDLSGSSRIFGGRIDLGPYENQERILGTGIPTPRLYHVYPNPGAGQFNLAIMENNGVENVLVRVFNLQGKLIFKKKFYGRKSVIPIDISHQHSGLYFLVLSSNSQVLFRQKMIKK